MSARLLIAHDALPARSQGYAFKVITALEGIEDTEDLVYRTKSEQIELLQSVLLANESEADLGSDMKDMPGDLPTYSMPGGSGAGARKGGAGKATRVAGSLQALAGYVPVRRCASRALLIRSFRLGKQWPKYGVPRAQYFHEQAVGERVAAQAAQAV